jgi:hypothetical protein
MLSEFDKKEVRKILEGHGDWFTANLMRLIAMADSFNKSLLFAGFPDEVNFVHGFQTGNIFGQADSRSAVAIQNCVHTIAKQSVEIERLKSIAKDAFEEGKEEGWTDFIEWLQKKLDEMEESNEQ